MEDRFRFRAFPNPKDKISFVGRGMINSEDIQDIDFEDCKIYFDNNFSIHFDDVILMQCTGLKDKNGKLIYEGDIIKDDIYQEYDVEYQQRWVIEWTGGYPGPGFRAGSEAFENFGQMTIVGNIYENPELLDEIKSK